MTELATPLPMEEIAAFCKKWRIESLEVFGSILEPEKFHDQSDVDFLATYAKDAPWSQLISEQRESELRAILGRDVDLVEKVNVRADTNKWRKAAILRSAKVIYGQAI